MREDLKRFKFSPLHFYRMKSGDKKGQFETNKAFAMHIIHTMDWKIELTTEGMFALADGGAFIAIKCILIDKKTQEQVGIGIASCSNTHEKSDFAANGQKASTWAINYAVDNALGLDSEEIAEIIKELNLTAKGASKQETEEPDEPETPKTEPVEDPNVNDSLFD